MSKFKELFKTTREDSPEKQKKYDHLPSACIVIYGIGVLSLIIYILSRLIPAFADFFNIHVAGIIRTVLSFLTVWIPFSLSEAVIISIIPIVITVTVYANRHRTHSWKAVGVFCGEVGAVIVLVLSLFVFTLGTGYGGTPVNEKLDLERKDVSAEQLYETALLLVDDIKADIGQISYYEDGFSVMPYSLEEMNEKLIDAYDSFCRDKDWISNFYSKTKPVMLSEAMSYTHITGVYAFFFGEANINIDFPDFTIPYTAAHELAHQRGIAKEDEANFVAYLVCIESDDPYIRYSANVSMLEYLLSALYSADKTLYREIYGYLPAHYISEQTAYGDFFEKYERSVASKVSGAINDTYLKSQGTQGSKSYGMVVDLAVAYKESLKDNTSSTASAAK